MSLAIPQLDARPFHRMRALNARRGGELVRHADSTEDDELSSAGELPPLEKIGVILAGDLFAVPDKRGAAGSVLNVDGRVVVLSRA
ncbi:MAG: hypothetical protein JNM17_12440 [Archangium sp.]|nr:hypothetical protein [Archangium sp.]